MDEATAKATSAPRSRPLGAFRNGSARGQDSLHRAFRGSQSGWPTLCRGLPCEDRLAIGRLQQPLCQRIVAEGHAWRTEPLEEGAASEDVEVPSVRVISSQVSLAGIAFRAPATVQTFQRASVKRDGMLLTRPAPRPPMLEQHDGDQGDQEREQDRGHRGVKHHVANDGAGR